MYVNVNTVAYTRGYVDIFSSVLHKKKTQLCYKKCSNKLG